jgi:predicted lysophospholipase L1 biosynthesis ABC-type transport system permease subunit
VQLEDYLRAVAVIGSGMAAGLLTTVLFVMTPLERSLDRSTALRIKNAQDSLIDKVNPPMVVISILAGLALLVLGDGLSDGAKALTAVGVVGVVGIACCRSASTSRSTAACPRCPRTSRPPSSRPSWRAGRAFTSFGRRSG